MPGNRAGAIGCAEPVRAAQSKRFRQPAMPAPVELELFHAPSSYYSMVARLALVEAHLPWISRVLDIHLARQQLSDAYRLLNPGMTVPTLRGRDLVLTDSIEILAFAATQAGCLWADDDPDLRREITAVVQEHAALSIETLTFSKLLASNPRLVPFVARLLRGLSHNLERRAGCTDRDPAALRAKATQNRERLQRFTQAPAAETLRAMRAQVLGFLQRLPVVAPDQWLFGARISRADMVLAVLIARLVMVEEWALVQRDDLRQWWSRYQRRPAFAAAEVWTGFRRGRFLQALLMAPCTPILSPAPPAAPGQAPPGLQPPPD